MTDQNAPADTPQEQPPAAAPPPPAATKGRSTPLTVLGILNIVFAGIGLIVGLTAAACASAVAGLGGVMREGFEEMGGEGADVAAEAAGAMQAAGGILVLVIIFALVGAALLLAGGIGLLKVVKWAWAVCIAAAAIGLVQAVLGLVMSDGKGIVGLILGAAYPVILLVFMFKEDIRKELGAM